MKNCNGRLPRIPKAAVAVVFFVEGDCRPRIPKRLVRMAVGEIPSMPTTTRLSVDRPVVEGSDIHVYGAMHHFPFRWLVLLLLLRGGHSE